ncbi:MAG: 16S rRNA (cytosine(1402)-N(4))-methyltransferase RsmH [Blastocatellia bacterium]
MEGTTEGQAHEPVLLNEVIEWLRPDSGGTFVDCTLGMGGHSEAILKVSPDTRVIGIDRDPDALALAVERLSIFENRFQAVHANFENVADVLRERGADKVRGVLADLGVSSLQLDRGERGFSFAQEAPLDMRMDQTGGETAADLVNHLQERELADLIFEYGEERGARRVARAIVRQRASEQITTTKQLADTVVRALRVPGRWRIHPATRTFQALRIAVNQELSVLETFIPEAIPHLDSGARLLIISFHSLEDRIVKRGFLRESGRCICPDEIRASRPSNYWHAGASSDMKDKSDESDEIVCSVCGAQNRVKVITRKPVRPSQAEIERNPRSRSAMLRVCERL